jgi:hypothetical protein
MMQEQNTTTLRGFIAGQHDYRYADHVSSTPIILRSMTPAILNCTSDVVALHIDAWNNRLATMNPDRVLNAFAAICLNIIRTADTYETADQLWAATDAGATIRLLNMPVLKGLEQRLEYVDLLTKFLKGWLRWSEEATGELTFAAAHDFVAALRTELVRRRNAWKASLTARLAALGMDHERLTAIVWHPRNLSRWLHACTTDAEENYVMGGWETEGVGTATA